MGKHVPWTEKLWTLVAEGPVSYDHAIVEMSRLVPPGRGYRNAEGLQTWEKTRRRNGYKDGSHQEQSKDVLIRQGKTRIARTSIWSQIKGGRIESYYEDGVRMLRSGPNPGGTPSVYHPGTLRKRPSASPRRMTPWTRHMWRRVATGPVPYDDLIAEAAELVPDETALGNANSAINSRRKSRGSSQTVATYDVMLYPRRIPYGKMRIARTAIQALTRSGRFAVTGSGSNRVVTPGPSFWPDPPPPED